MSGEESSLTRAPFKTGRDAFVRCVKSTPKQVREVPGLFTIGHEGLGREELLSMLLAHGVDTLVDVRAPQDMEGAFTYHVLSEALMRVGVRYHYMGDVFCQTQGESFRAGVQRLDQGAGRRTLMLLGRSEDPSVCVRGAVARAVRAQRDDVWHIRVGGRVESLLAS